jgi:hypothetical protein
LYFGTDTTMYPNVCTLMKLWPFVRTPPPTRRLPQHDTQFRKPWRMSFIMVMLAIALASAGVVAAEAHAAGSFSDEFPKTVLKKGRTVLQSGRFYYGTWHSYDAGGWSVVHADGIGGFPAADLVRAGSRFHIKIIKPERPDVFRIIAYKRVEQGQPLGEGRHLATTFRRVERDGKTVAWNVFFRVKQPDRHYYLETFGRWERVPGTHISFGSSVRNFHLKTGS